mgnify:FL=1|jgi:hypothetical protein
MQVHLPTEMSFLHNTRYYRLHLHYKRLYFWKGLKTNLATRQRFHISQSSIRHYIRFLNVILLFTS